MNGTLRGLSTINDVHIPPLRSLPSSRNSQAPLPFELIEHTYMNDHDRPRSTPAANDDDVRAKLTPSTSLDSLSMKDRERDREVKKPHLAISELVESPAEGDHGQVQLPSFVSLSVVEKSPTQAQLNLNHDYPSKRPRLDAEQSDPSHDMNRLLPRPVQKDDKQVIPLLPAMVTGLHEPPPSAALLPSMDPDARPAIRRSATAMSKMQVKDMLQKTDEASNNRPPEQMLNTPEVPPAELPRIGDAEAQSTDVDTPPAANTLAAQIQIPKKDPKVRRTRRKWSEAETQSLLAGVKKHGFGKWKQILNDPSYTFVERTSIDLKDRFRVFAKDYPDTPAETTNSDEGQPEGTQTRSEMNNKAHNASSSANRQRRKRHPWTREEDSALLQGVQQYGFQWTDIHNDNELGLSHRRATDLRDRIRNLYPEGYKHAEARPLRAEVKKAERAGKKETPAGTLYAPPAQMDSINFSSNASTPTPTSEQRNLARRQTTSGKVPSITALTRHPDADDLTRPAVRRSKTLGESSEPNGITLPSLALDAAHNNDDWDNTLPPYMNWEQEI